MIINSTNIKQNSIFDDIVSQKNVLVLGSKLSNKESFIESYVNYLVNVKYIDPGYILRLDLVHEKYRRGLNVIEAITEYCEKQKIAKFDSYYVFLENIDELPGPDSIISELIDKKNLRLILTSSEQLELSSEMQENLLLINMNVLSFEDYLSKNGIKITAENFHLTGAYFEDYLSGYSNEGIDKLDHTFYKRIIAKNNVREIQSVFGAFRYLISNSGKVASINRLAKMFEISPDTARRYLKYFCKSLLFDKVERFQEGAENNAYKYPELLIFNHFGLQYFVSGENSLEQIFTNFVYQLLKEKEIRYFQYEKTFIGFVISGKILIIPNYKGENIIETKEISQSFAEIIELKSIEDVYGKLGVETRNSELEIRNS